MFSWARRFQLRQRLIGSLWVIPLLGAVLGAVLGSADAWHDPVARLPTAWQYSAGTASGVLTTIIAAMVGLFGFVVTIGVLVVQMATGTLSPRFMRLWYRDRLQKLTLASFVGTVTFAFAVLRGITNSSVPSLGVSVAGLAFIVNLILLLLYLDRFVHNLRPVSVGDMVGRRGLQEGRHAIRGAAAAGVTIARAPNPLAASDPVMVVGLGEGGALHAINLHGLVGMAVKYGCAIEMRCSVGDFVPSGFPVVNIHPAEQLPDARVVAGMIALGQERSIEDDPAFALRIMVDIAIRALSPAVNDPTTAVQLINQIEALIRGLAPDLDQQQHLVATDPNGTVRLVVPVRTFEDYLRLAVTEIREYGGESIQVCRRLKAMLEGLNDIVDPACRPAVEAELARLDRTVTAHFPDSEERQFARQPDRQGIGGPDER
ncbi:DUF2254 domain-containing protein [Rhizocola hellebori]|uniref:DUF2254 domain-containing protein n=1 Tax=Rhizocola hellebori TaxID=1392758 RepID=UPI001945B6BE|nr:DUF2254 domain-containing protein [Rhizocola hellebori]